MPLPRATLPVLRSRLGTLSAVAMIALLSPGAVSASASAPPSGQRWAASALTAAGGSHVVTDVVAEPPGPSSTTRSQGAAPTLATSGSQSQVSSATAGFSPVTPFRVLDTRPGESVAPGGSPAKGRVGAGGTVTVDPRILGVPADATAVVLNVTGVSPTRTTFLTVYPSGAARPLASNLNLLPAGVVANSVTARVGTDGQVSIYNNRGDVDVVADVTGYYRNGTGQELTAGSPVRIVDTRPAPLNRGTPAGRLGPGQTATFTVPGATAATTAVALNVTGIAPDATTFLTLFPAGQARPLASALNLGRGEVAANLVVVGVTNGQFSLYNARGLTDVAVDLVGTFAEDAGRPGYLAQSPVRLGDTRTGTGTRQVRLAAGAAITLKVAPAGSSAVTLNLTGVAPTSVTYLSVYPAGTARPPTSTLNLAGGEVRPNSVLSAVDSRGAVTIYNNRGTVDVVVDVQGVFGTAVSDTPLRTARGSAGDFAAFTTGADESRPDLLIHWSCARPPIRYAINSTYSAGPDVVQDVVDAVARVSLASGLQFQRVADTTAIPQDSWTRSWPADQEEMVIAFANPAGVGSPASRSDFLPGGGVLGVGGWSRVSEQITHGFVVLDGTDPVTAQPGFGGNRRGTVLEHEVTHAIGLGHASDAGEQVMAPFSGPPGSFGLGDVAGLAVVGC